MTHALRSGLAGLVLLLFWPGLVTAHETTRSYLALSRDGTTVQATIRIAFRDIEVAVWIDEDLDGQITWGEVSRRLDTLTAYVSNGLAFDAGGACLLARRDAGVSETSGIAYLDLGLTATCPGTEDTLIVTSGLFSDIDPDHRMFLTASATSGAYNALLSSSEPQVRLDMGSASRGQTFWRYFREGAQHLMGGADHIIFLLVLMLPAICNPGRAQQAALGVLSAITGFTIAHALTLTAATTDLLRPPTALIEGFIALSIIVTAIDNVRPFIPATRTAVAAFFGLIHGFGFATALGGLHLGGADLAIALVGFNLGIEAAQFAVVLVTMPALYILGAPKLLLWTGSSLASIIGAYWLWVRLGMML